MLKKTITFKDLDDNDVTDDFYFNLSKPEAAKLAVSRQGGLGDYLERIIKANNNAEVLAAFEEIVSLAVGVRGEDNKTFEKSAEISRRFLQSNAWDVMFMELFTDETAGGEFVNALFPKGMLEEIEAAQAKDNAKLSEPVPVGALVSPNDKANAESSWIAEGRIPTDSELVGASQEHMFLAFQRKQAAAAVPDAQ